MTDQLERPVITPNDPENEFNGPNKKKGMGKGARAGLIVGGVAVASIASVLVFGGLKQQADGGSPSTIPDPGDDPETEQVDSPNTGTDTPEGLGDSPLLLPIGGEKLPTELNVEIPTGLSAYDLGQVFINRVNMILNPGANNPDIIQGSVETASYNEFVHENAQTQAMHVVDGVFVPEWPEIDSLNQLINKNNDPKRAEGLLERADLNLDLNLRTQNKSVNQEPWLYILAFVDAKELPSANVNQRIISITVYDSHNADLNRVGEGLADEVALIAPDPYDIVVTFNVGSKSDRAADVAFR